MRSSPMPVSTLRCCNFTSVPSGVRLYSMNTLFHISNHLPHGQPGRQLGWWACPSRKISESGPHADRCYRLGPRQLSSFGRK